MIIKHTKKWLTSSIKFKKMVGASGVELAYEQLWPIMCTTVQSLRFLCFKDTSHSFHHHRFYPLKTFQILSLHCSGFSHISQNTLDISSIKSLQTIWYDVQRAVNIGNSSLNLARSNTFHSISCCLLHTTTWTNYKLCHPDKKNLVHTPLSHRAQSQPFSTPLSEQNISCDGHQQCSSIYQRCHCAFFEPICDTQRA